jgi:hypothetical protein
MNKTYAQWKKQLDEFDTVTDAIPPLAESVRVWGVFAPAVPALYDAVLRELDVYKASAAQLRGFIVAHEKDQGDPIEFGEHLRDTIFAARRLKGLIDAYNREKAIVDAAFPEVAGGALKDANVGTFGAPAATKGEGDDRSGGAVPARGAPNGQERVPAKAAPTNVSPP